MTDSILADNRPITATLRLIGGPFEEVFRMSYFLTEAGHERSVCQQYVDDHVYRAAIDFLCRKAPNVRVVTQDDIVTGAKQIIIDDGLMKCIYEMSTQAQLASDIGVYPYTFSWSEPSLVDIAAYHRGLFTVDRESRWTGQESESLAYLRVASGISRRFDSLQVRDVWVPSACHEVPTTYCFDCGQMVPITDTWTKKHDPNYALCEACFRVAEGAGRAKEGMIL